MDGGGSDGPRSWNPAEAHSEGDPSVWLTTSVGVTEREYLERIGRGVFAHAAYHARVRHTEDTGKHSSSEGSAATTGHVPAAASAGDTMPIVHASALTKSTDVFLPRSPVSADAIPGAAAAADLARAEQDARVAGADEWRARTEEKRKGTDPLFMRNKSWWKRFGGDVIEQLTDSTPLVDARCVQRDFSTLTHDA